ncbi:hypothetical protein ACFVWN_11380 [Nocardiopsis flavescens]|uniref:hypothetical protein n=1 Tax=Nocardiopsis flavescens TaxID=758803 RepID=UPI0036DD290A
MADRQDAARGPGQQAMAVTVARAAGPDRPPEAFRAAGARHRLRRLTVTETGEDAVDTPPRVRGFGPGTGGDAVRFGGGIRIAPGVEAAEGGPLSTYTAFFAAGARADLPAPYTEVWVVLAGALRVGEGAGAATVRSGDHVHVPEHAPGTVEALEDTTVVCVSVPAH